MGDLQNGVGKALVPRLNIMETSQKVGALNGISSRHVCCGNVHFKDWFAGVDGREE